MLYAFLYVLERNVKLFIYIIIFSNQIFSNHSNNFSDILYLKFKSFNILKYEFTLCYFTFIY